MAYGGACSQGNAMSVQWEPQIETEADAKRSKRALQIVNAQRRERKVPVNRKALRRTFWIAFGLTLLTLWGLLKNLGL